MIKIGDYNRLKIARKSDFGLFLQTQELVQDFGQDILLPKRFVTPEMEVGSEIEVFISYDSEDRLVATLEKPFAKIGEFAVLEVHSVNQIGAFLSWGLSKDLFLPYSEFLWDVKSGEKVVVYIYLDKTQRIAATMRVEKRLKKVVEKEEYKINQMVDLILIDRTQLGYKAIVNQKHLGMLYTNQVFQKLTYGQKFSGYIGKIRDDGKLDLLMQSMGHHGADDIGPKILELLKNNNGFYPLTDKTEPDEIYRLFGVSKKKFKIALGQLYKNRQIKIEDNGIKIV
ncbi:MAG: GntR family transcriptional regulator [Bdellovibrionaceae bacterium]|nr:GntR family transcriptional regulator [Pseudobdellovibrionaceae bacterium]